MKLCEICNEANGSSFEIGKCYICNDSALKTNEMIEKAKKLLEKEGSKNFSISTKIPKDWLIQEERVWDMSIGKSESIKNRLNKKISSSLPGEYIVDGEARIVFDFAAETVVLERNDMFIFGRYKKLVSGLSQSRWKCNKCEGKGCKACNEKGKMYESVEERIGEPLKTLASAEDYVLHASGREDVDATNSAGRIFVMMLKSPKNRSVDLKAAQEKIGKSNEVSVDGLRLVGRGFVELVTESHFDKAYTAEVEFGREIVEEDAQKISEIEGSTIAQQTPKRVVHRRADLVRHRKIKKIHVEKIDGKKAMIFIKAEAGTYIKELISGDDGRTTPNISNIIGTNAKCISLDVSEIDDKFIDQF
ncbi:tRNA pseudouridine(54/55) synthase Pus10 [Candidatus Micrarchaeota archaeon]|nr:tRNA pseudouridine(54/55) synthase Pus10 [Candidatus Micrarchaeota archaeon]MBU1681980.1 tRNA pseudouridine(54/55) synthase Pus10 [Candidatus Micrarchaeota archaeon]